MSEDIKYLLAMSCILPAFVGIYNLNKTSEKYHPFIYMMILDVVIETIIYLAVKFPDLKKLPQMVLNIYILTNFVLFLYFVFVNKYLKKQVMHQLIGVALLIAIINGVYSATVFATSFYLLCYVSAVMLVIAVNVLSKQIMEIRFKLVNNFWFWVSSFSVLYNAFNLLIFGLIFFAMRNTPNGKAITDIQHWVNATCYLFFAVAIFKIPEKRKQSL